MAGAGLIGIKRRIKSVTNITKITKAMGLVSTAKLRRTRLSMEANNRYIEVLQEIVDDLVANYEEEHIFFRSGNEKKLYIILTSDSGLCGGYNVSIVGKAMEDIGKSDAPVDICIVGGRGKTYLNRYKVKAVKEFIQIPDFPTFEDVEAIKNYVLESFKSKEYGEIYVVYTKFVSAVKTTVEKIKLLPLSREAEVNEDVMIFEPRTEDIFDKIIENYISEKILNSMLNAKASEQSSRMSAMDAATKNGKDLLDKLNIKYNRVRQSIITQEISEIVGGAEAQK